MKVSKIILFSALMSVLVSCDAISRLVHDGDAVAKVGKHYLYKTELEGMLPSGLSVEDSLAAVRQIVNRWATEQLMVDMADAQLSKEEKDVSAELEEYKKSLISYRYEQRYLNERLDTLISFSEVEDYYNSHQDAFILDVPLLKARYLDIMKESTNYDLIRKCMSSDDYDDLMTADSLAYTSAIKYIDYSETWVDAVSLAREFGMDYASMIAKLKGNFIEVNESRGDIKLAYVIEIQKETTVAPLSFCEKRIRNIILSNRKHSILSTLEQDLLENAVANKKIVILESD